MDKDHLSTIRAQSPKTFLFASIAKTHLGEIAAVITTILLANGRLTVRQLSKKTNLTPKAIKSAIVSLIQLNCLYYWQENDKTTFYSINEVGFNTLISSGDILQHIIQQYGEAEAELVQNILMNGHIKIDDYLRQFDDANQRLTKEKIFLQLFNDGWLKSLDIHAYHHICDIWDKLFQDTTKVTPRLPAQSEVKRVAEIQATCKQKLAALLNTTHANIYITENGYKKLDPQLVITFNLARFQKHTRTTAFVNLASSRIGLLTSKVYEAALHSIEKNSPELMHPFLQIPGLLNDPTAVKEFVEGEESSAVAAKQIVFTAKDILRFFPKELDLTDSVVSKSHPGKRINLEADFPESNKRIKLENGGSFLPVSTTSDSDDADSRLSIIQQHLHLLATGTNTRFVEEISPGRYSIPFNRLTHQVKQFHYETLIKATLNEQAFRILRCIKQLKLADEKTIANAVLLKEKTVRNEIYALVKANVVEIQEIPRSLDRAASKTFYLFRYKEYHRFESLINSLIFDMAEIITNIVDFKAEHRILLDKCNRVDVEGHEEELLIESELQTLHGLQHREIKNLVRFNRTRFLRDIYTL
ncbi:uncharacterized protein LODBEIA_P10780 [Lodderomyces beijingensis]|uniref:DNA-directed RNA polymerase III subunit RPC3 n=1 Tax=Lodderomyces beijingensis TaxID=1775926 RepID=A0ABP0ZFA8_9ASCO